MYSCNWVFDCLEMRVMDSVVVNIRSFRRRSFPIRRAKPMSLSIRSKLPRTNDLDVNKTLDDVSPFAHNNRPTLTRYPIGDAVEADACLLGIKRRQKVVSSSCIQV